MTNSRPAWRVPPTPPNVPGHLAQARAAAMLDDDDDGVTPRAHRQAPVILAIVPDMQNPVARAFLRAKEAGDKQRAAEQEFLLAARKVGPGYSILRLGKLKEDSPLPPSQGAPPSSRAELVAGDGLSGDMPMSTAAAVVVETLRRDQAVNASFSLGAEGSGASGGGPLRAGGTAPPRAPSDDAHWQDQFLKLTGPEVYRRSLDRLTPDEAQTWLREWARLFLRPGNKLTTPVSVQDTDDGVLLRFLTVATGYADFDVEETADEKWAATKPGAMESKAGKPDGALLLTAEARPNPRVRVSRAEMADGVVVKEMSEATVLERLDKDLANLEKGR